jgi:hypothetical protein
VVDVVNGTGDQKVSHDIVAHLEAAGLTVGSVTDRKSETSEVQYADDAQPQARWLAEALDEVNLLTIGQVAHVTLILGSADDDLVQAVDGLPSCG